MFRERISRRYQQLSPSFRRLADFILNHHQRAAFMSASRLAQHLDVDVATVTRFAQTLGYEGFTELSREIQEQVLEEMRQARAPVAERLNSAQGQVAQVLWQDWANLDKTISAIRPEVAADALSALKAANRVYICSEGVGAGLAAAMAAYLSVGKPGTVVLDRGPFDVALLLKDVTSQDVMIGIGFTNYAYTPTKAMEYARKVGAKTIGIIGQASCPLGHVSDFLFVGTQVENGYLPSLTGVAAIIFALSYALYAGESETYNQRLLDFQKAYAALTEGSDRGEVEVVTDLVNRF
jgi:DNA-binding MurR/RpiR family transcriptional regulator